MSTSRGVERGSVAMYRLSEDQPVSDRFFNQVRLTSAITRLCISVVGHSHLAGVNQVVGTSIRVGIRIFNIVGGLGFEGGLIHECGKWLLVKPVRHLLRRLKMPGEA